MVPGGRRHGTSNVRSVCKAALRAISLIIGTGGDRAPSCAGQFHAGDRSAARPSGVDDLARVAPQRCHPGWRSGVSCDDGAVARRAIGASAEAGKARAQRGIAHLCGGTTGWRDRRLPAVLPFPARSYPGKDVGTDRGRIVGGPGPGARSRLLAACRSTSRTMGRCASATKPSTRRCSSKLEGLYAVS